MSEISESTNLIDGPGGDEGCPLNSLGDVQREMAKVYRAMRKRRIGVAEGNGLTQTLQYLASVMQDRRDSRWTKRSEVLWKEREAKSKLDAQPKANH